MLKINKNDVRDALKEIQVDAHKDAVEGKEGIGHGFRVISETAQRVREWSFYLQAS